MGNDLRVWIRKGLRLLWIFYGLFKYRWCVVKMNLMKVFEEFYEKDKLHFAIIFFQKIHPDTHFFINLHLATDSF